MDTAWYDRIEAGFHALEAAFPTGLRLLAGFDDGMLLRHEAAQAAPAERQEPRGRSAAPAAALPGWATTPASSEGAENPASPPRLAAR